jgi:Xaa-Pro aminopeptidase
MAQKKVGKITNESIYRGEALYNDTYPMYKARSFGLLMSDTAEKINMERMRRERLDRARRHMKEAGISVMLLLRNENMRYTTSYSWLGYTTGGAYVLLPVEGEPIVFAHLMTATIHDRRQMTWIKPENMRAARLVLDKRSLLDEAAFEAGASEFAKQIKGALKEMGAAKEVLTVDTYHDYIPALEKEGIRTAVDGEVLSRAQVIKTPDEIECLRAVATIADLVHYELAKYAEPGKTERELSGYMDFMAMKYGSDSTPDSFVSSGQYTQPNYRHFTDKMLKVGDLFIADVIQASFCGYKSCCYRTYSCVTPPSQEAKDAMKEMVDIVYAALSECKPGNTVVDMMKHWPRDEEFMHGGNAMHGLGLVNYGPPWGGRFFYEFPQVLEEGMAFAIEPERGIVGEGQGVRLEEMVVVTKDGCEVLTHAPLEIITCPLR